MEWPAAYIGRSVTPASVRALDEGSMERDRGGQEGRLGVLGAIQILGRALGHQPAQRLAQHGIGFSKDSGGGRPRGSERDAHADRLRPLSGEHECETCH